MRAFFVFIEEGIWAVLLQEDTLLEYAFFKTPTQLHESTLGKILYKNSAVSLSFIFDHAAQTFTVENLSSLKWWEKKLLIHNKIKVDVKRGKAVCCERLTRDYFLYGCIDLSSFQQWFEYFGNLPNPFHKALSMPLALADFAKKKIHHPWIVLVYGDMKKKLRHSVILHRHFYCARFLDHADSSEIRKTLDFIEHQTGIPQDSVKVVDIVGGKSKGDALNLFGRLISMDQGDIPMYLVASVAVEQASTPLIFSGMREKKIFQRLKKGMEVMGITALCLSGVLLIEGVFLRQKYAAQVPYYQQAIEKYLMQVSAWHLKLTPFNGALQRKMQIEKEISWVDGIKANNERVLEGLKVHTHV